MIELDRLPFLGGWVDDPDAVKRLIDLRANELQAWGAPTPGAGKGKRVLLYKAFMKALGRQPEYPNQTSGTCVGRGGARAADLMLAMRAAVGEIDWPGFTSSEACFAFARIEIGLLTHGARPPSDGASVGYLIEAMRTKGVLIRKTYEVDGRTITIPETDDDDLAQQWGKSRDGVPAGLEKFAATNVVRSWTPIKNYQEARDAHAAGYIVIFGTSRAQWPARLPAKRDKDGFLNYPGSTAHCWISTGFVDDTGRPGLVLDNKSWMRGKWVEGPVGELSDMPDGCYLCEADEFDMICKRGEAYAVSELDGFPQKKLDHMLI